MTKHLGEFEKLLLFALLATDDDCDGAALRQNIEERTGRVVSPGAVYTAMDRLQGRGYVASDVVKAPPELGGRRQKRYRLRPQGAIELNRAVRELEAMADGLDDALHAAVAAADGGQDR
ncbi:MAG: PadR family transcriptional regulator [Acidobacteria bacterium]|nr:PadR family transcriptional regulator [Acidobacteriota bacterium]